MVIKLPMKIQILTNVLAVCELSPADDAAEEERDADAKTEPQIQAVIHPQPAAIVVERTFKPICTRFDIIMD